MSSIIKLRWINLVGCILFATYGFLIGSLPVGLSNTAMAFINIYYLIKIYKSYNKKDYYHLLEIDDKSEYLNHFLDYYKDGIKNSVTNYDFKNIENGIGFFVLRNLVPAGIFLGSKYDDSTLLIDLDFVIPEYRDFKIGRYIYEEQKSYFYEKGITKIISYPHSDNFNSYLIKMGFVEEKVGDRVLYVRNLK
jgi:hypothetical protein